MAQQRALPGTVTIVVAMTPDRVIGRGGDLPWKLPADLARFKRLTIGHPLVMGRKTFDSIGRPLPGRTSIVLSRDGAFRPTGGLAATDLHQALAMASGCPGGEEVFVVGGGEVYAQALPVADRILATLVEASISGDAWFPEMDDQWRLHSREIRPADERNPYVLRFEEYLRAR